MDRVSFAKAYFERKGWSPHQAAAIVGNLMQESGTGLNPNASNPRDPGTSIGIGQWNRERKEALYNFAGTQNPTFEQQLDFVQHELDTTEGRAGQALKAADNIEEATAAFVGFERPQGWTLNNPQGANGWDSRLKYAQQVAGMGPSGAPGWQAASYSGGQLSPGHSYWDPKASSGGAGSAMGGFSGGPSQVAARMPENVRTAAVEGTGDMRPTAFQQQEARKANDGDQSQRARLLQAAGLDPTGKTRTSPRGSSSDGILDLLKKSQAATPGTSSGFGIPKFEVPKFDLGGILGNLFNLFK